MKMPRLLSLFAVLGLCAATMLFAPTTALASGVHAAAAVGACPNPGPYPPSTGHATIQSSTTTPFIGESIKASGINYCANEDVRLTIGGTFVGTAHTDASGSFDPFVTVPGPAGQADLCGVGASGLANDQDCLTLTIREHGPSGGGVAFTGVQIAELVILAVLLLGGGAAMAYGGRRRRSSARV
jgi:hypothetical protein